MGRPRRSQKATPASAAPVTIVRRPRGRSRPLGRWQQGCSAGRLPCRGIRRDRRDAWTIAPARAPASPGGTVAAPGAAGDDLGAPPASVTTTGAPLVSASTTTIPHGSGPSTATRRGRGPRTARACRCGAEPVDVGKLRRPGGEVDGELLLPGHGAPRHDEVQVGSSSLGARTRRAARRSPSRCRCARPLRRAEHCRGSRRRPGTARPAGGGTRPGRRSRRRPRRSRDRTGRRWPATCRRPRGNAERGNELHCGTRLHDDLAACQTCGLPVIAAAAHPYSECSEFECTTSMRRRRISRTRRPTATGHPRRIRPTRRRRGSSTDAPSGPMEAGAGGGELLRQRRATRQRDVAVELVGWRAAQHPHEQVIRSASLGDRLTESSRIMRAALNLEQFQPAPGGIGRYTAELARLLPASRRRTQTRSPWSVRRAIAARTSKPDCASSVSPASTPSCFLLHGRFSTTWHLLLPAPTGAFAPAAIRRRRARRRSRCRRSRDAARRDHARRRAAHLPRDVPRRGRRFHTQGLAAAGQARRPRDHRLAIGGGGAATYTAIPPERMRVVPNGVDLEIAGDAQVEATRRELGLDDAVRVLDREPRAAQERRAARRRARALGAAHRPSAPARARGPAGWLEDEAPCSRLRRLGDRPNPRPGRRSCVGRAVPRRRRVLRSRAARGPILVLEAMAQEMPVIAADIPALAGDRSGRRHPAVARRPGCGVAALDNLLHDEAELSRLGEGGACARSVTRGRRRQRRHGLYISRPSRHNHPDGTLQLAQDIGSKWIYWPGSATTSTRSARNSPSTSRSRSGPFSSASDRAPARLLAVRYRRLYPPVIGVTGAALHDPVDRAVRVPDPVDGLSARPRSSPRRATRC